MSIFGTTQPVTNDRSTKKTLVHEEAFTLLDSSTKPSSTKQPPSLGIFSPQQPTEETPVIDLSTRVEPVSLAIVAYLEKLKMPNAATKEEINLKLSKMISDLGMYDENNPAHVKKYGDSLLRLISEWTNIQTEGVVRYITEELTGVYGDETATTRVTLPDNVRAFAKDAKAAPIDNTSSDPLIALLESIVSGVLDYSVTTG